jgi:hypothetical protein
MVNERKPKVWACIYCHQDGTPYKFRVVTERETIAEVQVTSTQLKTVKRTIKSLYDADEVLIALVQDGRQ